LAWKMPNTSATPANCCLARIGQPLVSKLNEGVFIGIYGLARIYERKQKWLDFFVLKMRVTHLT